MSLLQFLLGRPLSTSEERGQRIAVAAGVAVFGLDALSSAAYGPEAALTVLRPLGQLGGHYIVPLSLGIIGLLTIVYVPPDHRGLPGRGRVVHRGAREPGDLSGPAGRRRPDDRLHPECGRGHFSGVGGALVSALPELHPHMLGLCLAILSGPSQLINLRGLREAGLIFMAPTYLFVASLLAMIVVGVFEALAAGGSPLPVAAPPPFTPLPRRSAGG